MEIINYEKDDINNLIAQAELIFDNYLKSVKEKSQLSKQESDMMKIYYKNILVQMRNLLVTLKAANISLQQIKYNTNQEKQKLNELYNNIALKDNKNPILEMICNMHNELNALYALPTTTINEIRQKYFFMNNHFMKSQLLTGNLKNNQPSKYKKPPKNT